MAYGLTNSEHYEDIASAIRTKNGKTTKYKPREMADAILDLSGSGMDVPVEYQEYVEHCKENLFTEAYSDLVVWDSTRDGHDWIAVSFLMDDFSIESFDPNTTEIKATGWVTCGLTVSTGAWSVNDYRNTVSPGGNYARYIEFASCEIEYNGKKLFPVGINRNIITVASADALPANAEDGTIAIVGV